MKYRNIIACLFSLLSMLGAKVHAADSIRVHGRFLNNRQYAKVLIKKFGIGSFPIAAANITNGLFSLTLPPTIPEGVYRLQYGQRDAEAYLDVIINGQENNIAFTLDVLEPRQWPVFKQSVQNQLWYTYKQQSSVQLQKIAVLEQCMSQYPSTQDTVFFQVEQGLERQKQRYREQRQAFLEQNKGTWAALMVQNNPTYFTNPRDNYKVQDVYRKLYFWDEVNTTHPKLLNTPLYTEKILDYLKYYMNPEMHFSEYEMVSGFKKSVDTIMNKFGGNEQTKNFALKYLQLGFKEIGQEEILQYIDENYASVEQCESDQEKEELEKRLAGYKALRPGTVAPPLELQTKTGGKFGIKQGQDTLILVFWASWCPHCQQEMPKLNAWLAQRAGIKALGISLDTDEIVFKEQAAKYYNMQHYCDYKKWNSPPVQDYFIVATPTFLALDKYRKIIGKYTSFEQLKEAFE